jgi:kynurenine formamidase
MALLRRHGDVVRADGASAANELFTMGGHTGTHIDALAHVSEGGRLHGGVDAAEAARGGRFRQLGVDTMEPIVCRGVLLDIPALLGRDQLEAAHRVTGDELDACCQRQGVRVGAGDAVLVRSGWPVGRWHDPAAFVGHATGVPGPDVTGARWLAERGVRVTGADTIAYEWLAPDAGHSLLPVHTILLFECGIHIIEVMDLEALARDRTYEFRFVAAPLRIVGATGSPIRPLALVE